MSPSVDFAEIGRPADLPKLAPDTIHRERLTAWLRDHADFPVRLVVAPSGSGKTTAVVLYAARSCHRSAYVRVTAAMECAGFVAALAASLNVATPADERALLRMLAESGRCEIIVDEAECAGEAVRDLLRGLVFDAPVNVTFVYVSRTRDLLDTRRLVSFGLAALMDADRLAFTVQEASRFIEAARVPVESDRDIARLVRDSDGWALALCGAVRDATACGRSLNHAFDGWQNTNARFIKAFLDASLDGEDPAVTRAAHAVFAGESVEPQLFERLEDRGLFVRRVDGGYRPYRAMSRAPGKVPGAVTLPPFEVRCFGRFEVTFGGARVEWIRRRDAHLFAFLAMQPHARASRALLMATFWPRTHPQLAAQSLRSCCSTMRRALAKLAGYGALSEYVTFGEEIALHLGRFTIDARRVMSHLADADAAEARGDAATAAAHGAAAIGLARAPFLDGETVGPLEATRRDIGLQLAHARARCPRPAQEIAPQAEELFSFG